MTKISDLSAAITPLDPSDLVEVVQDVATTPINRKVSVADLTGSFRGCALTRSTVQSIPTSTPTAVQWTVEEYDTSGLHDTSTNTSRITIPAGLDGYWAVNGVVRFTDVGDQLSVSCDIYKNGALIIPGIFATQSVASSTAIGSAASGELLLAAGDYLELFAVQYTGASKDVSANGCRFSASYRGV